MLMVFIQVLVNCFDKFCQLKVVEVFEKMCLMLGIVYIVKGEVDVVFLKDGGYLVVRLVLVNFNYLWYFSVDCMVESVNL